MITFAKATKRQARLRLAVCGPAGSGKTYSALAIGTALGERVALLDSEHGSSQKYSAIFAFDVAVLDTHHPDTYIAAIQAAEAANYDVLIIDSLSHAWMGKSGILELVDGAARRNRGNSFAAWGEVGTPAYHALIDAMLASRLHIIATLRSKMEYVQEPHPVTGKTTIRRVGMQPVQRDGTEYEFDLVLELDQENIATVTKTRCPALVGAVLPHPGAEVAETLRRWLSDGAPDRWSLLAALRELRAQETALGGTPPKLSQAEVNSWTEARIEEELQQVRQRITERRSL